MMSLVFAEIRAHLLYHFNQLYIIHSTILPNLLFLFVLRFVCPSVNSLYANSEDTCYFRPSTACLMLSECLRNTMTTKQLVKRILMTYLTCKH